MTTKLKAWFARFVIRFAVTAHLVLLKILPRRKKRVKLGPKRLLLTGTFYSENWIMNHLRPLLENPNCAEVRIICTFPISPRPKLVALSPPKGLTQLFGKTGGRLLYFIASAFKDRPDIIGGFHILMNGLVAAVCARLLGIPCVYFCGGGPREVLGGGYYAGNASLTLKAPDLVLESRLLSAINHIDHVITMGTRTINFFRGRGVRTQFTVIPGGIDVATYSGEAGEKNYDLILVGRIVEVKRVDLFLKAVAILRRSLPGITAAVVGTGELEEQNKALAKELRVEDCVHFTGYRSDVGNWLRKSRVFVLTSDSEGLSLALMEAMMCGLPAVVSDVGELGELVESGKNGFLVAERSAEAFAAQLLPLLKDENLQRRLSTNAREAALSCTIPAATKKWDEILVSNQG